MKTTKIEWLFGLIMLSTILIAFSFSPKETFAGSCRDYVSGAYHEGDWFSRSYDYSTNYPRAAYMASTSSYLSNLSSPPVNYTDYYAPNQTSTLINKYGWSSSYWNVRVSQSWESSTINNAETYSPPSSATVWQPYSTGSGDRFRDEGGSYYQYRRAVRVNRAHDKTVNDTSAPTISLSPGSSGWTSSNITVDFDMEDVSCAGYDSYRFDWSNSSSSVDTWSGWSTASSASKSLSSQGTWYFHINARDNHGNAVTKHYGPYRIDKTDPTQNASVIYDAAYVSGGDYWIQPGDSVRVRIKGYDAHSGIKYSYLKITGGGQDNRSRHDWTASSTDNYEWMTGIYTDITAVSETTDSGGYREAQYSVKALTNSNNQDFNLLAYYTDNVNNQTADYIDIGKNVRVDGSAPTVTVSPTSSSWTNSATVSLSFSDTRSGINYSQCKWTTSTAVPTSAWDTSCGTETISSNGTWYMHYRSEDKVGNVVTSYKGPYYVDTTDPSGVFTPNSDSVYTQSNSTTFNPSDTGGSGVDKWRYRTSSNNGSTYGSWSSYINGDTNQNISFSSTGQWKVQAEVVDNAGNVATVTSGTFNVDNTNPSGSFTPNSDSNWTQSNTTSFNPGDTGGAGVKQWRYRTSSNNGSTYGSWSSYITGDVSQSISVSTTGVWKIEAEVTDNAGNVATVTSGSFNVDTTNPSGAFTPNSDSTWTQSNTTSFNPSDTGGAGVKQWRYRTSSNNGSTYGSWSSYITGDVNQSISASSTGIWRFQAEVTDNAGNVVTITSGSFNVDNTNPSGAFTPNSSPWDNVTVNVSFNPSDTGGSGVSKWRYQLSDNNGSSYGSWSSYVLGDTSQSIALTSTGRWRIKAEVVDGAGNTATITSGTYEIDKVAPVGTITKSSSSWQRTLTLTATGTDSDSGMNRVRRPDGTYASGSTATYVIDKNGVYTFTFEDVAGNTSTSSITITNIDDVNPFVWGVALLPDKPTNGPVDIQLNAGDAHSGVKHIVLPNNTVHASANVTYTVTDNGIYPFTIVDKVGNSYQYFVTVNNVDKVKPTVNTVTLLQRANGKYDVTVVAQDDAGVQSVTLNTGQVIVKQPNSQSYVATGLTTKPTSVTVLDKAGNSSGAITFLDIPTIAPTGNYSTSKTMKEDAVFNIDGTQTLSYTLGLKNFTCSTKPCAVTFTKNDVLIAKNEASNKLSMREFEVTNIDKTKVNLVLKGSRGTNNLIKLEWNLNLTSPTLKCTSSSENKTFAASSNSYTFAGKNETYQCALSGFYEGNTVDSNTVSIYPDYSETVTVYTPPSSMYKELFPKVYKETSRVGEFYFLNINRDNTGTDKSVPIPDKLRK